MKTFLIKVSADRPGQEVDVCINESGEFTPANIKVAVEVYKNLVDRFPDESPDVKYSVVASQTNSETGSKLVVTMDGTKAEMLEFKDTIDAAFNNNQQDSTSTTTETTEGPVDETSTTTEQVVEDTTTEAPAEETTTTTEEVTETTTETTGTPIIEHPGTQPGDETEVS